MVLLKIIIDKSLGYIFYQKVCKVAGSADLDRNSLSVLLSPGFRSDSQVRWLVFPGYSAPFA